MIVTNINTYISENTRDLALVTWEPEDILGYINEGIEDIIKRAPQANSRKELVICEPGIDQALGGDTFKIVNVVSNGENVVVNGDNVVTSGAGDDAVEIINVISNETGEIIHQTDVIQKDAYVPNWKQATPAIIVKEWMKRSEPTMFMVFPPLADVRNLLVEYSFFPTPVTVAEDTIVLQNQYLQALRYFCMYKVYSRDSESTPTNQTSELFFQKYEKEFITE